MTFLANLSILVLIHSYLRWVVLILLVSLLFLCFKRWMSKARRVSIQDERIAFWASLSFDLMFIIGLFIWVLGNKGYQLISTNGFSEVMKSAPLRFYVLEHPVMMFISLVLVHLGKVVISKKHNQKIVSGNNHKSYRKSFFLILIALIFLLVSIPWPGREGIGAPLFYGITG